MKTIGCFCLLFIALLIPSLASADNPVLGQICSTVDCLNNFTPKGGYSFDKKKLMGGGFTDLKQSWYVSPAIGFDAAKGEAPNFDVNAVFKFGKLVSDKVPYVHDFVNSHPFTQGLMKYTVIGETGAYDYNNGGWYDLTWVGFNIPLP